MKETTKQDITAALVLITFFLVAVPTVLLCGKYFLWMIHLIFP